MSSTPPAARGRLSRLIYLYTAVCVGGTLVVFLAVATWHFVNHAPRPHPPAERASLSTPTAQRTGFPPHPPPPNPPPVVLLTVGGILLVAAAAASPLFTRHITRPLRQLEEAALALGSGDHDARAAIDRNDEIGAAGQAFDKMAEQTTRLLRAHDELLANVAHELRAPLTRMRVALEMAAESHPPPDLLNALQVDVRELQTIVDDVLSSLRLAMTDRLSDTGVLDLGDVVASVEMRFREIYPERDLRLEWPQDPVWVSVESELLGRAVYALLDNAQKYSEREILLRGYVRDDTAIIEVKDRGCGIEAAHLTRIFEPFFRADSSRHRETGGVGLGLSLVQRIVSAHGGSVSAHSDAKGTRIRIELPRAEPPATRE